jgi:hypothetical protein
MDVVFLAVVAALTASSVALVVLCERLMSNKETRS